MCAHFFLLMFLPLSSYKCFYFHHHFCIIIFSPSVCISTHVCYPCLCVCIHLCFRHFIFVLSNIVYTRVCYYSFRVCTRIFFINSYWYACLLTFWFNRWYRKVVPYTSGKIWSTRLFFLFFWQCVWIYPL